MNAQSHEKNISKCCANPAFKPQLSAEGLKVSAVEDSAEQFVIPAQSAELTDDMLECVVGGRNRFMIIN
jgi:hypothetical protein